MSDSLRVTIDDKAVRRLLEKDFPKQTNQGLNRGYRTVASKFTRSFAKARLGRGGPFHVKRKVQLKKVGKGQPAIAPAARKAGFVGTLSGQNSIHKKSLSIRTSNPILVIREFGGTIRPKKGTRVRGKSRRIPYLAVKLKRRGRGASEKGPDFRLVKQIQQAPILGFRRHWQGFQPQVKAILRKSLDSIIQRINKLDSRRRARRAS